MGFFERPVGLAVVLLCVCVLTVVTALFMEFVVPESIVQNLWELENFTSNLFERQVKQITLEMFSKKE
jgi:hypothetical protein